MLGGYAVNTPADTFMQKSGDTIRNDLARLRGARLVTSSEPQARKFDPELVKAFVGRDPITARFLRQEFFEYEPVGKLLFAANQRPQVSDNSLGFWRRVRMIPFTEDFRQCRDENLREKLIAESPGILNWLVKACLKWQVMGLNPPAAVSEAVNDYREATDILWEFLHTRSEMGPGLTIAVSALYDNYLDFCDEKKTKHPLSRQKFNEDLRGRDGIIQTKEGAAAHRVRVWKGIGLKCSGSTSCQCGNEEGCVRTGDRHTPDGCEHYAPLN
jgi:putative DNA primase/helicase